MGIGNAQIAMYTSLLLIPWTIKPLWSPIVEMISTRRKWTLASQLLLAICFAAIAAVIPSNHFLTLTLIAFFAGAFVSSTHDIALDGFYILGLSQEKQSFFSGIRNTFYRIATVFSSGVLVMLANKLGHTLGSDRLAWSATFAVTGIIMLTLWLYHTKAVPLPESDIPRTTTNLSSIFNNYGDIIKSYFQKPGIWQAILFLLLFRFPEAQLGKIGKLFLMDNASSGGLALDKGEIGFIYGVLGVIGLIIGGIAGGICISRKGLKYWLWPMVIAISLPDAVEEETEDAETVVEEPVSPEVEEQTVDEEEPKEESAQEKKTDTPVENQEPVVTKKKNNWKFVFALIGFAVGFAAVKLMERNHTADVDNTVVANVETVVAVSETEPVENTPVATDSIAVVASDTIAVEENPVDSTAVAGTAGMEQPEVAEPVAPEEEVYTFVMVDELAATPLKNITLADTLLYVADGELARHKVAANETLTKIARTYYGDKKLWPYIVKFNNMRNPNGLGYGMEIGIPRLVPRK